MKKIKDDEKRIYEAGGFQVPLMLFVTLETTLVGIMANHLVSILLMVNRK